MVDFLFFFKQKTAYELRITGVQTCALPICSPRASSRTRGCGSHRTPRDRSKLSRWSSLPQRIGAFCLLLPPWPGRGGGVPLCSLHRRRPCPTSLTSVVRLRMRIRSEEHTSELQSLMRISYAVFCLKKKNKKNIQDIKNTTYDNREDKIEYKTTISDK